MPLLLVVCFLAVPLLEIYVILQVGGLISTWPTVALLLADSILGAWVLRHEGIRAWRSLHDTLQSGRMPDRELANAALILIGGTLLLTPGFVTDAFGFLFVLPFTRPPLRRVLVAAVKRRLEARIHGHATTNAGMGWRRYGRRTGAAGPGGSGWPGGGTRPEGDTEPGSGSPGAPGPRQRRGAYGPESREGQSDGAYGTRRVVRGHVIDDGRD